DLDPEVAPARGTAASPDVAPVPDVVLVPEVVLRGEEPDTYTVRRGLGGFSPGVGLHMAAVGCVGVAATVARVASGAVLAPGTGEDSARCLSPCRPFTRMSEMRDLSCHAPYFCRIWGRSILISHPSRM